MTITHDGYSYIDTEYVDGSTYSSAYVYIYDCAPSVSASPKCGATPTSIALDGFHWPSSLGDHYEIEVHNDNTGATVGTDSFTSTSDSWSASISFSDGLPSAQYRVYVTLM